MAELNAADYAILALIILVLFAGLLAAGNMGNLFRPLSPQTEAINQLYRFIYISGSAVGSIFLGALFFIIYRFREKGVK
ncbi:MAG: hypothetical protein QW614_00810 [Candidatus Caldarchaeum sp.]|uniref:Respiratory chain protein (SoxI-like) n=1 Tax=Caldiarchaeum subterraneum TaxID=311458 RepID=A0A7C5QQT8_CALS0